MNITLRITDALLASVRADLGRPHRFALERVGFLTAGAARVQGGILLLCRAYHPVGDEDYERSRTVGAQIGSAAMRKGLEAALANNSALIHVHSHGGRGNPDFSGTDLRSADEFVPGFFNALPRVPHGLVVLSDDSARGVVWTSRRDRPRDINGFVQVGSAVRKFGATA